MRQGLRYSRDMKKLLAITALAALALTGCGASTGKPPSGPPALVQPANHETAPATSTRVLWEKDDLTLYEVTGTNSGGYRFRCMITDGNSSVAQTCVDLGK